MQAGIFNEVHSFIITHERILATEWRLSLVLKVTGEFFSNQRVSDTDMGASQEFIQDGAEQK